ncbi:hypothetical protein EDD27_8884 [Nonomuraea polychroma]|uniref:Uncharacterized protein n=1 Tax=Nonomuraea polychroma TaxID=46176 RepID=A0A438MJD9_9ACTN|nr:hypothetical protein [Nonomuraea polychroma]RVX46042.1 hypothetical protein EDD27_8884 [Nonomuraea polychroma]
MNLGPYTHISLSMYGQDKPQLHVSFHTPAMRVGTLLVKQVRPVLCLETSEACVMISTTGGDRVTDQDVNLARQIVEAATRYLADCERLHADRSAPGQATTATTTDTAA